MERSTMLLMGKSTVSMAIFHCYVSSPGGKMWKWTVSTGLVWKCCVPHCTQWFCWSLSLLNMAISLGVYPIFRHTQLIKLRNYGKLTGKSGLFRKQNNWWKPTLGDYTVWLKHQKYGGSLSNDEESKREKGGWQSGTPARNYLQWHIRRFI